MKHTEIGFYSLLVVAAFISATGAQEKVVSLTSVKQHETAKKGSTITLLCAVEGDYDSWFNSIVWFKTLQLEDGKEEKMQMNTNALLNEPFKDSGRHDIVLLKGVKKVSLHLKISDVNVADDGTYTCKLTGGDTLQEVKHSVLVPAEIDEVILTTNRSYEKQEDNTTKTYFQFEQLEPTYLSCRSEGGNPMPTVKIMRHRSDITAEFEHNVVETRTGPKGLQAVHRVIELVKPDFMANVDYSGHNLKCVSRVRKTKGDELHSHKESKTVVMEVQYAPIIDCEKDWAAFVATESFALECAIRANPQVEADAVSWRLGNEDNATQLKIGEKMDGFSANITFDKAGNKANVKLIIDTVNTTHFQTYKLTVKNPMAEVHFFATLRLATTTISTSTTAKPIVVDTQEKNPTYDNNGDQPGKAGEVSSAPAPRPIISVFTTFMITAASLLMKL